MATVRRGDKSKTPADRIKAVQKADKANKKCADTGDVGPTYVILDYNCFVCTQVAGIHREFNHKVKGITMSKFTDEEVEQIESSGGNEAHNDKYLARWEPRDFPLPDPSDTAKVKEFLRMKYVEKRWMRSSRDDRRGGYGDRDRRRDSRPRDRDRDRDRDRERSRSRGAGREEEEEKEVRERDRERDRDRDRDRNRDRERDRERRRRDDSEEEKDDEPQIDPADEEAAMIRMLGFNSFDSSKEKDHSDAAVEGIKKQTKRKYRQYMNRRGGFNRPLDATF
mmetsp:Transcript_39812/g.98084  ORF Transcript_39812/g.98084 Transcript_39812/m.98084 type:complete len:280 (-) Transcript_39812:127-966(-)